MLIQTPQYQVTIPLAGLLDDSRRVTIVLRAANVLLE